MLMIFAQNSGQDWGDVIIGLAGGGTFVAIIGFIANRGKNKADEVATIVTSAGESVKLSSGLLATYVAEVQRLTKKVDAQEAEFTKKTDAQALELAKINTKVSLLEGALNRRDHENSWLRARVHQLEDYISSVCNFPVPNPVPMVEEEGH